MDEGLISDCDKPPSLETTSTSMAVKSSHELRAGRLAIWHGYQVRNRLQNVLAIRNGNSLEVTSQLDDFY